MKKLAILFNLFLFVFFNTSFAETSKKAPLIVGTTTGYAPFVSLDAKGNYEGFDIDMAYELGKKLGRDVKIADYGGMPGLMMALKQGKIDMILWAVGITEERMQKLELVHYQGKTIDSVPFLFWEKIPENIHTLADLERQKNNIVTIEGGTSQEDLVRLFPKIQLKCVDKVLDVILDLRYGKCLTTTIDPALIQGFVEKYPQIKVLHLPIPPEAKIYGNGVAISKANQVLAQEIKTAVAELKTSGKIAELEVKWNLVGQ